MKRALAVLAALLILAACDGSNKDRLTDAQAEAPSVGPELDNVDNMAGAENDLASAANILGEQPQQINEAVAAPKASVDPNGPSFQCAGLLSSIEDMICSNPDLAKADRAASDRFVKAMKEGSADEKDRLRAIGRRFMEERNSCGDPACVAQAYDGYAADVNGLMGWPSI